MADNKQSTRIITGKVRLSYANIWKPRETDGGDAKYSVRLLIPKTDKETLRKIKAAVEAAKEDGRTSKWGGKIPATCKMPLRDGDAEFPDDPVYAGQYFLNTSTTDKPGIVKPVGKGPDGKMKLQDITDTTEVYSGCFAKVSIGFFAYDTKGNRGVGTWLYNIVKVQDGEPLGGRRSAQEDFADEDFEDMEFMEDDEDFMF